LNKQEIFAKVSHIEEQIGQLYTDLGALKEIIVGLLEENQRLTLENAHLRQWVENARNTEQRNAPTPVGSVRRMPVGEGYDNLARLYHEGFHICHVHYGSLRTEGDCLFCLSFLNKS